MGVAEVIVAQPRGFCAGVVRAINIVELALEKYGSPVYVKHAVVHNDHVVKRLEAQGAVTVDTVDQVPDGGVCVFSAHGSRPEEFELAKRKGLRLIDGTCPLVTKVHNEVKKYAAEGRVVVVIGHSDHVEVQGTKAQTEGVLVIDPDESLHGVSIPHRAMADGMALVTQTTLSQGDVAPTVEVLKKSVPDVVLRSDICYATTNRQEAVAKLAERQCGMILVVGSEKSSNCKRLVEVARKLGVEAWLVDGPDDSSLTEWMASPRRLDPQRIGITSGASTPEDLVQAVIEKLAPATVTWLDGPSEDFTFKLPQEVRDGAGANTTGQG